MKVASLNISPCSVISGSSPTLSFRVSFVFCGQYCER